MDETYRMLGREHPANLEREAQRRELAAAMTKRTTTVNSRSVRQLLLGAALSVLALAALIGARAAPQAMPTPNEHQVADAYLKLPLSFIPNAGQTDPSVRYFAHGAGFSFYFTDEKAVLAFVGQPADEKKRRGMVLNLRFVGATSAARATAHRPLAGQVSYFRGSDPAKWQAGLPTYEEVVYRELWHRIDLRFRGTNGRLKYEFALRQGASPQDIRLAYGGAKHLSVTNDGALLIHTPYGALTDARPRSWQRIDGRTVPVETRYVVEGSSYGFALGAHDPRYPLVIDPGLAYSTFLGGSAADVGRSITLDDDGNAYVTGDTRSLDFPTRSGAFDTSFNGVSDAFVTKLNDQGSAIVYSTYVGGSGLDLAQGIAVDDRGNAFVAGFTNSSDFPTTPGAFQQTDPGPGPSPEGDDGFVTKLSPSGKKLVYSTYLGGAGEDTANGIAVDEGGNAYVGSAGATSSFPTTPGAFQETDPGPTPTACPDPNAPDPADCLVLLGQDVVASKLNPSGSALVYATYLGGSSRDILNSMTADEEGHFYAAGATDSTNFPTTPGAFQPTDPQPVPPGPSTQPESGPDGFVAKLNRSGSGLVYSTYLGGTGGAPGGTGEGIEGVGVDRVGHAFATGRTDSAFDFPTTPGAWDTTYNGGSNDAFVSKFNVSGSALVYSTYLGGSGTEEGGRFRVALNPEGSAYITSLTNSTDFPTTPGAFQTVLAGNFDVYVTVLNPVGSGLAYSTYLGGSGADISNSIAVDGRAQAYVTGRTSSANFPITGGAFDTTFNGGGRDVFVTKLAIK